MLQKILLIAGGLITIYAGFCALHYLLQKKMIHIPKKEYENSPDVFNLEFEDVYLHSTDGNSIIHGWYFLNSPNSPTILIFGGNAGNMSYHLDCIQMLYEVGFSIMIYDYREFGQSTGELTEQVQYEDADLVWHYLTETRGIVPEKIALLGRSLGGAMASWVASQYKPGALIMESSFTSMLDMGKLYYRWLPVKLLLRWQYDNLTRIPKVHSPVLFVHSKEDELTPFHHSEQMYERANQPKRLLVISGGHLDGYWISSDVYVNGIKNFIENHIGS